VTALIKISSADNLETCAIVYRKGRQFANKGFMLASHPSLNKSSHLLRLCLVFFFFAFVPAGAQSDSLTADPSSSSGSSAVGSPDDPLLIKPHPPDLNYRPPIPSPPAVALPSLIEGQDPKPFLSWRSKAFQLANERPSTTSSTKLAWSLPISFDRSEQLLTSALSQTGFQLIASYVAAGHYLAAPSGGVSTTQIIIVVQPITPSLTSFQLRVCPEGHRQEVRRIEELPKVMNTILGTRGLL
jgi:hypothetical protein